MVFFKLLGSSSLNALMSGFKITCDAITEL